MPESSNSRPRETLAIVGIGCRFPGGVVDPESFWKLLIEGRSAISEVPDNRWDRERYFSGEIEAKGKMVTKWGGFVDQLDEFDADFFSITPREASRMDPQQRWLLEITQEAMDDAFCPAEHLAATNTGVFVGFSNSDYSQIQGSYVEKIDGYTNSGNSPSIAANRISFHYDLKGPSLAVDTACSSGLVAVDLACKSIWSGECSHAFAGGSSALILPVGSMGFSKAGMLSPTGRCRAFDAKADGYVRSEGAGMILIKPLSDAIRDGNRIYSLIRATVSNQDGRTTSLTVPSLDSQRAMLEQNLAETGISPRDIAFIEAHGTGTPVGDPIEARALGEVIAVGRSADEPCIIGSVKTNIGHLETASGLAGIIKAALVMKNALIPPNLHFDSPNPNIPFEELRLRVVTEPTPLPSNRDTPPVAVVNSFGFGGANAQAILQKHSRATNEGATPSQTEPGRPFMLPVSAASSPALKDRTRQFRSLLNQEDSSVTAICAAASVLGQSGTERLVAIGETRDDLLVQLKEFEKEHHSEVIHGAARLGGETNPLFVFSGQGSQWWAMGRDLIEREPIVQTTLAEIDDILQQLAGFSIREELGRPEKETRIDTTSIAQPSLFALQVALAKLWHSWGIEPGAVIGHSVGEVAAAHTAGIYDLETATELVYQRSRLQQTTSGNGGMAVVGLSREQAAEEIEVGCCKIEIAAVNSPSMVTLTGDRFELEALVEPLQERGIFTKFLPIAFAFHSRQMDCIEEELLASLANLRPNDAVIPFFSTVEGKSIPGSSLDADYWWKNIRQPVEFARTVSNAIDCGHRCFLEIGPHPALSSSISDCLSHCQTDGNVLHSLKRDCDDSMEMARNLAELHVAGIRVDWCKYLRTESDPEIRLPCYPWQRKRLWIESPRLRNERKEPAVHPFLVTKLDDPLPGWETLLDPFVFRFLDDHRFWGRIVFPAAGFAEMGIAVAKALFPDPFILENLVFSQILFAGRDNCPRLRVGFEPESQCFSVHSFQVESEAWTLHSTGRVSAKSKQLDRNVDLRELRDTLPKYSSHWDFYEDFSNSGYKYGETFQQIEQAWYDKDVALARVMTPDSVSEIDNRFHFHPTTLDACLQAIFAASAHTREADGTSPFLLPSRIDRLQIDLESFPKRFWVYAIVHEREDDQIVSSLQFIDDVGQVFGRIDGFTLTSASLGETANLDQYLFQSSWIEKPITTEEGSGELAETQLILFSDRSGIGEQVAKNLRSHVHSLQTFYPEDFLSESGVTPAETPTSIEEAIRGSVEESLRTVVLHLWSFDHPFGDSLQENDLRLAQETGVQMLLQISKILQSPSTPTTVICGAWASVASGVRSWNPASASLLGFLRTAANELPGIAWKSLLIGHGCRDQAATAVVTELNQSGNETEILYDEDGRRVRRLAPVRFEELPRLTRCRHRVRPNGLRYQLVNEKPGTLDRIGLVETVQRSLEPDQVEVRVVGAGINFRDLMKLLKTYPGKSAELAELGDEFSGVVSAVGSGVTRFSPGDEVVGMSKFCFQSHVIAPERTLFLKPVDIGHHEAAGLSTVFLTAFYAIDFLARLQPGQSILIHAAAGGVGLAAIQVAQRSGLTIFATAGSETKRKLLRSLGVEHVMDSRSLAFADQIMEVTDGRGVDAVLNSLSGEYLLKSLSVLAPFGKFLEIGKVDIFSDRKLGMSVLRNNISFHAIDLAQFLDQRTQESEDLFRKMGQYFEDGIFSPTHYEVYPASEATSAFRKMARGEHSGKLVLDFEEEGVPVGRMSGSPALITKTGSYLVAGGASGFGFEIIKWLAANGVSNLVMLSRTGPRDEAILSEIESMQANGIQVRDERVDITDLSRLQDVIEAIENDMPAIVGVFHAAMILEDQPITELNKQTFEKASSPKILGGWNLHEVTRHCDLEYFVCFSSIATVLGSFKQANYNSGNAFLDELCHYRHQRNLPALSVSWGPLAGAGYVEREDATRKYLEAAGLETFNVNEVFRILERLLTRGIPQIAAAKIDWHSTVYLAPAIRSSPFYENVIQATSQQLSPGKFRRTILAAPAELRRTAVEDFIKIQISEVFATDPDTLDPEAPLSAAGLDSLMAIELLNRIENELGIPFPMGSILNAPSIRELTFPILDALLEASDNDVPAKADIPSDQATSDKNAANISGNVTTDE